MSSMFLDLDGNRIPEDQVLGYGGSGLVIFHDGMAVKNPVRYSHSTDADVETYIGTIQHEQDVYRRLDRCDGVVPCIGFSKTATQLAFMKNGDLRTYLTRNQAPKALQLSWFREMAHALARIHDRSVIVADIASRNFLLDTDLSIKFCDFSESSIMPLDSDMDTIDDKGYSVQTDIGELGAVFYEVVTGERCGFDLYENQQGDLAVRWPRRESLPRTQNVWLGPIIEQCWTKGAFRNAHHLAEALDSINLDNEEDELQSDSEPQTTRTNASIQPVITLALILGALTILTPWVLRWSLNSRLRLCLSALERRKG
ncbi:serine/threonine protein kinase [Emergomyces pasteurianus Ep9510]|uniref:Serine/threonine protein kinase n=1 Tax=Emergomyces pasteurianus Ep9510 TaxID=1447872 RepID=A0A1J9PYH7_9EURO|nr:serine/threonine protein kinase [Emergomyces pasteurianus Ep9510]